MSQLVFRITGDPSSFNAAMGQVTGSLNNMDRRTKTATESLSRFGNTMSLGVTLPALALGKGFVTAAVQMDSLKRGLEAVSKTGESASVQLDRLREVARLPGLGLREAAEGSTRLQAAGFSAQLAERALKGFGNALATVGKGKAELDGVTLALSQIASKGKISAEEINQLAERVPQIRVLMKEAFGTADTEVLQKAGIEFEEFVTKIVERLEQMKQVTSGPKTALETLGDAAFESSSRIGEKLFPALERTLPKLESLAIAAADAVDTFSKLPESVQTAGLTIAGLAIASGPIAKVISKLAELRGVIASLGIIGGAAAAAPAAGAAIDPFIRKTQELMGLSRVAPAASSAAAGISSVGVAAGAAGIAVGGLLYGLNNSKSALENQKRASDQAADGMRRINESFQNSQRSTTGGYDALLAYTKLLPRVSEKTDESRLKLDEHSASVENNEKHVTKLRTETWQHLLIQAKLADLEAERNKTIHTAAEAMNRFGQVSAENTILSLKFADSINQWHISARGFAADLPAIVQATKDIMSLPADPFGQGRLPTRETFDSRNVGPTGMMTEEQLERLKRSASTQTAAMRQVSTAVTNTARGITDLIFQGGKVGDVFKKIGIEAAKGFTQLLVEKGINVAIKAFTGLISKVFDLGGALGKVFGGAAGVAGNASGGIGGAISGAAGGVFGAVTGAISAVSGVIGNFQMAGMNKTLDLLEKEARFSQIHLLNILQKANEFWPYLAMIHERLFEIRQVGVAIHGFNGSVGGAASVNVSMAGAYLLTDAALGDFADRLARLMKARGL